MTRTHRRGIGHVTGDTRWWTRVAAMVSTSTPRWHRAGPLGLELGPQQVPRRQDPRLRSIAAHGIGVLSVRDGLEFGSDIVTDGQPLNGVIAALLDSGIRCP